MVRPLGLSLGYIRIRKKIALQAQMNRMCILDDEHDSEDDDEHHQVGEDVNESDSRM